MLKAEGVNFQKRVIVLRPLLRSSRDELYLSEILSMGSAPISQSILYRHVGQAIGLPVVHPHFGRNFSSGGRACVCGRDTLRHREFTHVNNAARKRSC